MNILVTGGTGFIGQHLCELLAKRGHNVTALARNPDSSGTESGEIVVGDVTAYESIVDAFADKDVVVNLVALSPLFIPSGGNEMHERIHLGGTKNCLRAAEKHDVDRFVQMSALGADSTGATHYIRAKGRAEEAVSDADIATTIVRPSVVFGDDGQFLRFVRKLTPPVVAPLPGGGETRFQPIFVEDLVTMLADTVEDKAHSGETYDFGGPEVLTLAEVAKLVRKARGQSVTIVPVPMSVAGVGMTLAGAIPGFPMGRDQYQSLQFDNTTEQNDIDAFGFSSGDLRTVSEYVGLRD
ncbi:complex I NDUFA9 subunit family protein [Halovenus rubra]|uniref:Complex I NDUFA9 subunit family protein n=2 Tax=Halovenus rubra TaxID=869890 RepID=A0ACC7E4P8_9EURY|nr:complex I NDUFA9 subunit family protein [Halovenus rubra]